MKVSVNLFWGLRFFRFDLVSYKYSRKTVSAIFCIIPLKLALISLGAQLDHSAEHLGTSHFEYLTGISFETISAVLWLVSSAAFQVEGDNFESNEPYKGRDKQVNTLFLSMRMDMNCSCPHLYSFLYLMMLYSILPPLFNHMFHKVSRKLKILQQTRKKSKP